MSPERQLIPHRLATIAFDRSDRQALLNKIALVADVYGFARQVSADSSHPGELLLQLYRDDMKMVGATSSTPSQLDVAVYKTPRDGTPLWAIDQAVEGLERSVTQLRSVAFTQHAPPRAAGPEQFIDSFPSLRLVEITLAQRNQRSALAAQLSAFADRHGFAILISRSTPDPDDLSVDMYRDDVIVSGFMPFAVGELKIRFRAGRFPDGEQIMPADRLGFLVDDLKLAIQNVPGAAIH